MTNTVLNSSDTVACSVTQSITGNDKCKDTLFRYIFTDPQFALPLVNAFLGTSYENPSDIQITTVEDILQIAVENETLILIDCRMMLCEKQPTPNLYTYIPFLDCYCLYVNQKQAEECSQDSSRENELPIPCLYRLYNGTKEDPEIQMLKLSDLYKPKVIKPDSLLGEVEATLEVEVPLLNIHKGLNEELMDICAPLREYSECIDAVKEETRKGRSTREGIVQMLNTMDPSASIYAKIQSGRAEVERMLETEFNLNEYGEVLNEADTLEKAVEICKKMMANPLCTIQMIQELTGFTEDDIHKIQETLQVK